MAAKYFSGSTAKFEVAPWLIIRNDVEAAVGRSLTDDEWFDFIGEIDGRVENFCNELYDDLVDRLGTDTFKPKPLDKFEDK